MVFDSALAQQHNNQAAVQQGIGNMDHLIQPQKQTKSLETELWETPEHFSSMSLHFGEVEAQHEEHMMTVWNLQSSDKKGTGLQLTYIPIRGQSWIFIWDHCIRSQGTNFAHWAASSSHIVHIAKCQFVYRWISINAVMEVLVGYYHGH